MCTFAESKDTQQSITPTAHFCTFNESTDPRTSSMNAAEQRDSIKRRQLENESVTRRDAE